MSNVNIPMEAFKDAICVCGNNFFNKLLSIRFYPPGVWSKTPIILEAPRFFCGSCGVEFDPSKVPAESKKIHTNEEYTEDLKPTLKLSV